jgi:uncharacterized protein
MNAGVRRLILRALCVAGMLIAALTALGTEIPFLSGRVADTAGILSGTTIDDITRLLKEHEDSTSNQVAVLTIASLEGEAIEAFSIRVVESWKLGRKDRDNGVLLLVSRDDRKVRIEVGRGLEGALPDITCGSIIRREILPRFKSGDFDGGVLEGTRAILQAIAGEYVATESDANDSVDPIALIVAGGLFLFVVGTFTMIGIVTRGAQSWFLYLFLIPFWAAFPMALLGFTVGGILLGTYLLGFPVAKLLLPATDWGKRLQKGFQARTGTSSGSGSGFSSGGWSSSSGSSGSSFSGGGGSFGGGGSSGSW